MKITLEDTAAATRSGGLLPQEVAQRRERMEMIENEQRRARMEAANADAQKRLAKSREEAAAKAEAAARARDEARANLNAAALGLVRAQNDYDLMFDGDLDDRKANLTRRHGVDDDTYYRNAGALNESLVRAGEAYGNATGLGRQTEAPRAGFGGRDGTEFGYTFTYGSGDGRQTKFVSFKNMTDALERSGIRIDTAVDDPYAPEPEKPEKKLGHDSILRLVGVTRGSWKSQEDADKYYKELEESGKFDNGELALTKGAFLFNEPAASSPEKGEDAWKRNPTVLATLIAGFNRELEGMEDDDPRRKGVESNIDSLRSMLSALISPDGGGQQGEGDGKDAGKSAKKKDRVKTTDLKNMMGTTGVVI